MAGKDIVRNIVLNGKVGSGFEAIGNTLMQMGAELETVSNKIINFGKDSLETYKDFEYNMAQARIAQSTTYGMETKALDDQMARLNQYAAQWARETMFHTNDVSNAIMLASRANMNVDEIIATMPSMIDLAKAGGIDLSEAVNYVVTSMNALGIAIDESNVREFTDMWVYAANRSVGSVKLFGDTMQRLGSTGRFSDSNEELFAMIALMHNMGTAGSEAGTLLRTSWMRLVAPSGVTSKVLEYLGATKEEYEAIRDDFAKTSAFAFLQAYGFSAYDEAGKLKPMLTIFKELRDVLIKAAGPTGDLQQDIQNLNENKTTNGVLGAIFGTRGITGALNMMMALDDAIELENMLLSGAATGYGAWAQQQMMETLYGSTEMLGSKVEELERRTGETLAPQLKAAQDALGGIVDSLSTLDEGSFNALVKGAETLAGLSMGLTATGLAFKFIGHLMTPGGAIAVGLGLITSFSIAVRELEETEFSNGFGFGEIDKGAITSYISTVTEQLTSAKGDFEAFKTSVQEAKASYETASATFSTNLLSAVVTGNQLDAADLETLSSLGTQMFMAITKGISDAKKGSEAYWDLLLGGEENEENRALIQQLLDAGYQDMLDEAASIDFSIKEVLMKGINEGFTEDDYERILTYMREYNALIARASAEAQSEQDWINMQLLLHKAQTADIDELIKISDEVATTRNAAVAKEEEDWLRQKYHLQWLKDNYSGDDPAILAGYDAALEAADRAHERRIQEYTSTVNDTISALWGTQIKQSDYGKAYEKLGQIAETVIAGGTDFWSAIGEWEKSSSGKNRDDLKRVFALMLEPYGGTEGALAEVKRLREGGFAEQANELYQLITMSFLNSGNYSGYEVRRNSGLLGFLGGKYETVPEIGKNFVTDYKALGPFELMERGRKLAQDYVTAQGWLNELGEGADWYDKNVLIPDYTQQRDKALAGLQNVFTELQNSGFIKNGIDFDVNAIVNSEQVKEYTPEDKDAYVFYHAVLSPMGLPPPGHTIGTFFAEGGRATQASIFGEGDVAEWAIPEEHTERTAELLNAARVASGFTWPEIIDRFGGLNADVKHQPTTIVYSPTINANDVTGVREALNEDKERLEKWMDERKLKDAIEMYA